MFRIQAVLISITFLMGSTGASAEPARLNALMANIGEEMTAIYPLIHAQRELSTSDVKRVSEGLKRMTGYFEAVGPLIQDRAVTYKVSYDYITPYLNEVIQAFDAGKVDYARNRLYGISAICTSCHTQDTKLRTMFKGRERKAFESDYLYAEFNYFTRNYTEAEKYFDLHLKGENTKTEFQIIKPLQRLITIYTQIYNNPGEGAQRISAYAGLADHSRETSDALKGWIKGLQALDKAGAQKVKRPDFKTLERYVKRYLGDLSQPLSELYLEEDEQISRVWLRGLLYHYLNDRPKPDEIPKLLYWLSICDRSVGFNFYFSLSDMYLKDCVKNYTSHPYAKRCYAEYREFVMSAYSGSGGVFLPVAIEDELFELKALLKKQK